MKYQLEFKPRAVRDSRDLDDSTQRRVMEKIEALCENMTGGVKRLTHFTPEYRLRVGDIRVLFEADRGKIVVYRVVHRRDAYR